MKTVRLEQKKGACCRTLVGPVTPCAPMLDSADDGAHGVTRPTFQEFWQIKRLAIAALFSFVIAAPQSVSAHGEVLIQIAAISKKIEAATNNAAQLYLDRAELHREHKDWDAAKLDYDRASKLDAKLDAVDFCRARMLDDSGQLEAARAMFNNVIRRSPKDGEAFIGRARVLVKLREMKPAVADFRQGLELLSHPKPEYFLELAQALAGEGNRDDALRSLDEGIKKFGPIVLLQAYALEVELERKNHEAALTRIDSIIKDAPRKESWLAQRGDILLAAGRPAEAQNSFGSALSAIKLLPSVLQKASPMQNLQSHIDEAMGKIATPSVSQN
jgi:tetratricopeptide (TPR) repeat protein